MKSMSKIMKILTNRLLLLFVFICITFYILVARMFELQIVKGNSYDIQIKPVSQRQMTFNAPRGTVYDRYGRPLAINSSAFNIKIDPSVYVEDINRVLFDLLSILEKNNENYVDDFPITKDEPFEFIFDNEDREARWKKDMEVPLDKNALETMAFLKEKFAIDKSLPNLSDIELRKLLALRSMLYMERFRQYLPITIAYGVSDKTITALEEEKDKYICIYADVESLRVYPQHKYFANLLGYIRKASDKDLEKFAQYGYTSNDIIGKAGLERAFELELRGTPGKMAVQVNSVGKRLGIVEDSIVNAKQGDKIFITLDQELQVKTYDIFEATLKEILINKLSGKSQKESPISLKQFFTSYVKNYNINFNKIIIAEEGSYQYPIRQLLLPQTEDLKPEEVANKLRELMMFHIDKGDISTIQMILVLWEQGLVSGSPEVIEMVKNGKIKPLQFIIEKIEANEITPQMANLDPSTGSVIVTDIKTGDVLTAISYPAYDNNFLVNNFDNDYWYKINRDLTTPMINRPFSEPRAPGSSFKMLTAITGMEMGAITPSTLIYDGRVFEKAGEPFAKCYSSYSHGSINVSQALEVSCNYFFFETAYRMGNAKDGNKYRSIDALVDNMEAFGFGSRTGVEVGELADDAPLGIPMLASPEYKAYLDGVQEPNPSTGRFYWSDGDTIRVAIGQSINNYTAASMVKYGATLANEGDRYQLHLLDRRTSQGGDLLQVFEPVLENKKLIKPEFLNAVYKGMLLVTEGSKGTAAHVFRNFPIRVAGKTGTAQQATNRNDHSTFIGFAPYENPQVAIYVSMPFGDTDTLRAPAANVAKRVLTEYFKLNSEPERKIPDNSLVM